MLMRCAAENVRYFSLYPSSFIKTRTNSQKRLEFHQTRSVELFTSAFFLDFC